MSTLAFGAAAGGVIGFLAGKSQGQNVNKAVIGAAAAGSVVGYLIGQISARKGAAKAKCLEKINDRTEFINFCKAATKDKKSPEYAELYAFLLSVFKKADRDFDGLVTANDFDIMVEMAGSLPRMLGLAPTSDEAFADEAQRVEYRRKLFQQIDKDGSQGISFDEWLGYVTDHIREKVSAVNMSKAGMHMMDTKATFMKFVVAACKDRQCAEYKELYNNLLQCFTDADSDMDGKVTVQEFDQMIDIAAELPRKFGFAPPSSQTYPNNADKAAARAKMFKDMDNDKSGYISFEEWLDFCYKHICEKAVLLDNSLSGRPPARVTSSSGCQFNEKD